MAHDDERERLIHDLEVHQTELESQNRELRETHELLEQSRSRYADLYDFAPVAYLTFDQSGAIRDLNLAAASLLGAPRERLVGKLFASVVAATDKQSFRDHLRECLRGQERSTAELTLTPTGRQPIVVEMASVPFLDRRRVVGCRSALIDVTARKRAEDSLRQAVHMREEFLAVVSHDLRNPLNSIRLATEMLLRGAPGADRQERARQQLCSIQRATDRVIRLVSDLLDLSSMEAGHLSMHRSIHDLRELVSAAVDSLRPLAEERSLRLAFDLPDEPLHADCDGERMLQTFSNLLANAIKFTAPSGAVTASAKRAGGELICEVRDTGVGISQEQQLHIFEPYWQADRSRVRGDAGLGLAIARGIVEFHGGRIWVESTPGKGSSFFFSLPAATHQEERGPPAETAISVPLPAAAPSERAFTSRRVLIVDDVADTRNSLAEILVGEGYQVLTAANGREALDLLRESDGNPGVVLLDLVMPVMDGWAFLAERERDRRLADIPVVLISGQADAHKLAGRHQLAGYIEKPIAVANLFRTLEQVGH